MTLPNKHGTGLTRPNGASPTLSPLCVHQRHALTNEFSLPGSTRTRLH